MAPLSYLSHELSRRPILPLGGIVGRAYLRFSALDRPGALAHITGILGDHAIGIEAISQTGQGGDGESVPVLVKTDPVREAVLREALEEIERLSDLSAPTRLIRIEEGM